MVQGDLAILLHVSNPINTSGYSHYPTNELPFNWSQVFGIVVEADGNSSRSDFFVPARWADRPVLSAAKKAGPIGEQVEHPGANGVLELASQFCRVGNV